MSPEWQKLLAIDEGHLANTLANAAVVTTSDGKVILLNRSGNVGECPNTVVYPGGHPEPKDVEPPLKELADWDATTEPQGRAPFSYHSPSPVLLLCTLPA